MMIREMTKALKGCVRKKLGSTLYFLFYFCGFLYTGLIITSNVMNYFKFTSNLIQTEILKNELVKISIVSSQSPKIKPNYVQIPNLIVCSDSMHSKQKVEAKYPQLNKTSIQQLYGLHVQGSRRSIWGIRKTRPDLFSLLRENYEKEFSVRVKSF